MHVSNEQQSTGSNAVASRTASLPEELRPLFWDCKFEDVNWTEHRDFVIGRILSAGGFDALRWLRRNAGDDGLRGWFNRRHGRELDLKQLRFWELILNLPKEDVDRWISQRHGIGWDDRLQCQP